MRNIRLLIEYDGTNYAGWQKQKNALTIEEVVEKAITCVTNENIKLIGSSRTDSGVHALAYCANFSTKSNIPSEKFKDAINSKLPKDIVILSSEQIDKDFHARYSCTGKTYIYTIVNRYVPIAVGRNYCYHYKQFIDTKLIKKAIRYFLGKHDFKSFMKKGSSVKTTTRTITQLDVERDKDIIKITISADGFLYNMVRIIVGTLIDIGVGKIEPEDVERILQLKDRTKAGRCVPPQGLCLMEVHYKAH